MNDVPGHSWELRHEDAPNLMDRTATVRCIECNAALFTRYIQAFRSFSFRDRESLEQAWATHIHEVRQRESEQQRIEREKELLPY